MNRLLWSLTPRRTILSALALVVLAAGLVAGQASAGAGSSNSEARVTEARIKAATAKYHSVDRAIADGFVPTNDCAELPGVGGMGYHYVNPERLADAVIDPNKPDILLYATGPGGRLRLAGAEWFAADPDQDPATDAGRPSLFGHSFDGPMPGHEPGMPVHFDLHAWVWRTSPAGTFAPWNPAVHCP